MSTEGSQVPEPRPKRKGRYVGGKRGAKKPSKLLRDMRLVISQEEVKDRGPQQVVLRTLLKDDPKGFVAQLAGLERAHAAKSVAGKAVPGAPSTGPGAAGSDEGEERALAVAERLLAEYGEGVAE